MYEFMLTKCALIVRMIDMLYSYDDNALFEIMVNMVHLNDFHIENLTYLLKLSFLSSKFSCCEEYNKYETLNLNFKLIL